MRRPALLWFLGAGLLALIATLYLGYVAFLQPGRTPTGTIPQLSLTPFLDGIELPVAAARPAGDDRLFIVQLNGLVQLYADGRTRELPFLDLRDRVTAREAEQGFYSLAFHPLYRDNGRLFVSYTERDTGDLVVAEHRVWNADPDLADPNFQIELFRVAIPEPFHHGGQLAFGDDGFLYVGVGDGLVQLPDPAGGMPASQDLRLFRGKLLRLDVDSGTPYGIPQDNPFTGSADARPEIYAIGFRNPWKFSFDDETGQLFLSDVGDATWEEIDLVRKGGNYGWPLREGASCTTFGTANPPGLPPCTDVDTLQDPIAFYGHAQVEPAGGNAITGGFVYRGEGIPELQGQYLFGDFVSGRIWSLAPREDGSWQRQLLLETGFRVSGFAEDSSGEPLVFDISGSIHRLGVR